MDETLRVVPARTIRDSHGAVIGHSGGFRPDPVSGNLGLDVQLTPEARDELRLTAPSLWVDDDHVLAVRRDEIVIDWALDELRKLVHENKRARRTTEPAR